MSWWQSTLVALAMVAFVWAAAVALLVVAGRRSEARALARFVPDCLELLRRLIADERIPRRRKLVLVGLAGYLALPFDVVPDFIPVAGQLDDAVIVALTLRAILRGAGPEMIEEHWPGPRSSLSLILRLAGQPAPA
jgi:uncharacterized membrane protein YkvA (DUF1232 family)